jgi:hypothetical protein
MGQVQLALPAEGGKDSRVNQGGKEWHYGSAVFTMLIVMLYNWVE